MADYREAPAATSEYPAYVEFTVRMNVESEWEFDTLREAIGYAARRMSTVRLIGDEAAVQVLYRQRPGVRPIDSDPQEPPPFTFERLENESEYLDHFAKLWQRIKEQDAEIDRLKELGSGSHRGDGA